MKWLSKRVKEAFVLIEDKLKLAVFMTAVIFLVVLFVVCASIAFICMALMMEEGVVVASLIWACSGAIMVFYACREAAFIAAFLQYLVADEEVRELLTS